MYQRILVATDGSTPANRALDHAVDLAAAVGSRLLVVAVAETGFSPAGPEYPTRAHQTVVEQIKEEAKGTVDAAVQRAEARDVEVRGYVHTGRRAQEGILDVAGAEDVDLIVLGTHGRSGLARFLLGSVTEEVLRRAEVPILAVRDEGADG